MNFVVTMMSAEFATTDVCDTLNECQRGRELGGWFQHEVESTGYADDATWIMTSSFVIFTRQTGFGLLEMGSCQAVNILLKNVVDVAFGSLVYCLLGSGIAFGTPSAPFMGQGRFAPTGDRCLLHKFDLALAIQCLIVVIITVKLPWFCWCKYAY
jgi:hypothetical protein